MLDWLFGGGKSEAKSEQDSSPGDAPETPAQVFAARAFRTALFGTPAPPIDPKPNIEEKSTTSTKNEISSQSQSLDSAKPCGILVTPGTALSRRKTVTFGSDVQQDVEKIRHAKSTNDLSQECHGRLHRASTSDSIFYDQPTRVTPLTREMERAREGKLENKAEKKSDIISSETFSGSSNSLNNDKCSARGHEFLSFQKDDKDFQNHIHSVEEDNYDEDITINLNEPRSNSGKYWKSEFNLYNQGVTSEIRKLLGQREAAKLFGVKEHARANELAELLKEEQQKVLSMQEKISSLMAKLASTGHESDDEYSLSSTREHASPSDMKTKITNLKRQLEKMATLKLENDMLRDSILEKDGIIRKLSAENKDFEQRILELNSRPDENDWKHHSLQKERSSSIFDRPQRKNEGFINRQTPHKTDTEHKIEKHNEPSTHYPMESRSSRNPNGSSTVTNHRSKNLNPCLTRQQEARDISIPNFNENPQVAPPETIDPSSDPRTSQFKPTEAANNTGIDSIPSLRYGPVQHSPLVDKRANNVYNGLRDPVSASYCASSTKLPHSNLNHKFADPDDHNYQLSSKRSLTGMQASPAKVSSQTGKNLDIGSSTLYKKTSRSKISLERFEAASKRLAEKKKLAAVANSGKKRNLQV
ncbi:hypothetical protein K3495_g9333 [Podosphaera aphanis]|nr:hypothetical protein K3495_g9333 [Podosphaera aphanis]